MIVVSDNRGPLKLVSNHDARSALRDTLAARHRSTVATTDYHGRADYFYHRLGRARSTSGWPL